MEAKLDSDTTILDTLDYYFRQFWEDQGKTEPDEIKDRMAIAICRYVYRQLYKPDDGVPTEYPDTKLDLANIKSINVILDYYLDFCFRKKVCPGKYGFASLTGLNINLLYAPKACGRKGRKSEKVAEMYLDVAEKLKFARSEYVKSALSETQIGTTVLANNDKETGLMFTQQQIQAQAEAWMVPADRPAQIAKRHDSPKALPVFKE